MTKESKILTAEYIIIILLWAIAIVTPIFFGNDINKNWRAVQVLWAEFSIIGFAFIVNRFILMPYLFFEKKYTQYSLSLLVLLGLIALFIFYLDGVDLILALFNIETLEPVQQINGGGIPPPRDMHPQITHPEAIHPRAAMPAMPALTVIPPSFRVFILAFIVIALDMGLSIAAKWLVWEQKQAEMKRESISAQLSNLQNQVSPHFFMNTLNNIHALVEIDPKTAQKTIIELSGLMDYLLYESSNIEMVSLQRELEFIESYISLMRLRYPKRVKIEFEYSNNVPTVKIPPLLFLNFIENTFKYGVDYSKESFINITFTFNDNSIEMVTCNSNHSTTVKQNSRGIGISNSHKRLKLLYDNRYNLNIENKEGVYSVVLKIPII